MLNKTARQRILQNKKKNMLPKDDTKMVEPKLISELTFVEKRADNISYIDFPNEKLQLIAVRKFGVAAYKHIKNPTDATKVAAAGVSPEMLKEYEMPEAAQIAAVANSPWVLEHIKNPSLEVIKTAVKKRGNTIRFVDNPNFEIQTLAVTQDADSLMYIKRPAKKLLLKCLAKEAGAIRYIPKPSLELQLFAVAKSGNSIKHIENPCREVQLEAIRQNVEAIYHIKDACQDAQSLAVELDYRSFEDIQKPTIFTQIQAVKLASADNSDYFDVPTNRKNLNIWIYNTYRKGFVRKYLQRLRLYLTCAEKPVELTHCKSILD